ncbi:MAG TPA: hypothetical protein DHV90_00605 [Lactobacillus sp.]|nr:hypothetical protein [Lactobacillus sp.]
MRVIMRKSNKRRNGEMDELLEKMIAAKVDEVLESQQPTDTPDGKVWGIKDFCHECCGGRGRDWVREHILYPFRDQIGIVNNPECGWVYYPGEVGGTYLIRRKRAQKWMEDHFNDIDWRR